MQPGSRRARRLRRWSLVHKWASLVPTVFLLLLCLTGLPLIFKDEIAALVDPRPPMPVVAPGTVAPTLDSLVARAEAGWSGARVAAIGFSADVPTASIEANGQPSHRLSVDLRTGERIERRPPRSDGFMNVMLELHKELYLGLPGALFLGAMGLLLVVAIVSGVVLYVPFMHRLAFGTLRAGRNRRASWLDLHNLFGIVTVAWLLVVGVTGAINTLHDPIAGQVRARFIELAARYRGAPPPARLASVDAAAAASLAALPGMQLSAIWYPGTRFSTPHHYAIFLRGSTPVTARMLEAVLIDAETGRVTDRPDMPWYAKVLFVSEPLHFGDYGGLPLKIVWALLDLVTIGVLVSGLYLWLAPPGRPR